MSARIANQAPTSLTVSNVESGGRAWRENVGKRGPGDGDGPFLPLHDAALDDDAAGDGPGVTGDSGALVDANVAIERDDVAGHGAEYVEVAASDGDGSVDVGVRRDGAIPEGEHVGVGQVRLASGAPLGDLLGERNGVLGRGRDGLDWLGRRLGGRANRSGLRWRSETSEGQCGKCEQRAHCYALRRLETAARARSPATEPAAAVAKPSSAAATPIVPVRWMIANI